MIRDMAYILPFFLLLLPCAVPAGEPPVIRVSPIYKEVDGRVLRAHVFRAPDLQEAAGNAAVAFFHGGGWAFGEPAEFFAACKRYARKGMVSVSFEYRLSINPDGSYPHPDISPIESVKDARSAVRWLRANAADLGVDPDRIVASGQSAGGQLALATALLHGMDEATDDRAVSPAPNAIVLYSSCVNTLEPWIDNLLGDRSERIWDISPYHRLRAGMPPVLAFHGDDDGTVLYYTIGMFQRKMRQLGNAYELVTLPGRDHYLGGDRDGEYAGYFDEAILEQTDAWLRRLGILGK